MADTVMHSHVDLCVEKNALRKAGLLGRGGAMGNSLYAIDYDSLPPEARRTIGLITSNGPFPYLKDGTSFENRFGDLPNGRYLEYTVPTPGFKNRGWRRIVERVPSGQLFFTACHYERVQAKGGTPEERAPAQRAATATMGEEWRNGFYVITGMTADLRNNVARAIQGKRYR